MSRNGQEIMKATVNDLDKVVMEELDNFAGMLPGTIEEAQKTVAKTVVKQLKHDSPQRGKNKYAKGWRSTTTRTRTGAETVIYNGAQPGLVHLLEYGHPKVNGGRTREFVHVQPAEDKAVELYTQTLERSI